MLLISDLELVDNADYFETRLKAGGVLDVAEKYPWTGEQVLNGRFTCRRPCARIEYHTYASVMFDTP